MQSNSPAVEQRAPSEKQSPVYWDVTNPMGYAKRMGSYKTRIEYEFMPTHIPSAPARVLDIAGGSGRFATKLLNAPRVNKEGRSELNGDRRASRVREIFLRLGDLVFAG